MNMRSKIATAVIAAAMLALPVSPASAGAASGFGDVSDAVYYTDAVAWLVANDITTGIEPGCFGPSENVTRGQVAAFLFRYDGAIGHNPISGPHPFTDVLADYQMEPIGWLFASGIATGTGPTTFAPDAPITRGDFAALLWRYAGRPAGSPTHQFADVRLSYQQAPVSWMFANGITTGTSATTFSPDLPVDRGQAATFLFRFAAPGAIDTPGSHSSCSRGVREALVTGGLTPTEAQCAAPHLLAFSVDYLVQVVEGQASPSTALIDAIAAISGSGCLTQARIAELIQLYF